MNEEMKVAWMEITQMLGETTPEELDVFLRTWQRAILAEREEILAFASSEAFNRQHGERSPYAYELANAIRARGQA